MKQIRPGLLLFCGYDEVFRLAIQKAHDAANEYMVNNPWCDCAGRTFYSLTSHSQMVNGNWFYAIHLIAPIEIDQ